MNKHSSKSSQVLRPKKQLGQNFLTAPRITERIIQSADLSRTETVLEIGPGKGALTKHICPLLKKLISVEKDPRLIKYLKESIPFENFDLRHQDILMFSFQEFSGEIKVIGNIPYNISTPIIEKLIKNRNKISAAYLTVQWEFGRRVAARHGGKDYGALSCFAQYHCRPEVLFKISRNAFSPAPKVESCFLKLDFENPFPEKASDEDMLFQIIRTAFQQRRKTILNSLSGLTDKENLRAVFDDLEINEKLRAENLSLKNFIALQKRLAEKEK